MFSSYFLDRKWAAFSYLLTAVTVTKKFLPLPFLCSIRSNNIVEPSIQKMDSNESYNSKGEYLCPNEYGKENNTE